MEHSFNIKFAEEYGIEEAIIVHNIFYWIDKNAANEKHCYDGSYWTYNSVSAFSSIFPYMNSTKIYRVLNKLVENDIIKKGNYNKEKFDNTCWYSFTDKGLSVLVKCGYRFSKMTERLNQSEMTIPNNKQHIINIIKEDKDKSLSKKEHFLKVAEVETSYPNATISNATTNEKRKNKRIEYNDQMFENCWNKYGRHGSKAKAFQIWNKLSEEIHDKIKEHIPYYVESTKENIHYRKHFEGYLKNEYYLNVIYKGNNVIFDPNRVIDGVYRPQTGEMLNWSEYHKCYISWINPDYDKQFYDGYEDEDRPSGASVKFNGYTYRWNADKKKWDK